LAFAVERKTAVVDLPLEEMFKVPRLEGVGDRRGRQHQQMFMADRDEPRERPLEVRCNACLPVLQEEAGCGESVGETETARGQGTDRMELVERVDLWNLDEWRGDAAIGNCLAASAS
jgi:hypothetical protein